ncbi:HNH endonuclease [Piscinibacter koreensis]|uniref:HNH endonuclease n=1 Tax=Piscinibacter koreensis TaxID=2742824 RepID=A0A7Y6TVB6_9BURK|nr:HNH endonuclease [Schlegelella koreensis]
MWEEDLARFAGYHQLSARQASLLRSSAEHLLPRSAGGSVCRDNIVAACVHCNRTRHKARSPLDPDCLRMRVRKLVAAGRWLPQGLHRLATMGPGRPQRTVLHGHSSCSSLPPLEEGPLCPTAPSTSTASSAPNPRSSTARSSTPTR